MVGWTKSSSEVQLSSRFWSTWTKATVLPGQSTGLHININHVGARFFVFSFFSLLLSYSTFSPPLLPYSILFHSPSVSLSIETNPPTSISSTLTSGENSFPFQSSNPSLLLLNHNQYLLRPFLPLPLPTKQQELPTMVKFLVGLAALASVAFADSTCSTPLSPTIHSYTHFFSPPPCHPFTSLCCGYPLFLRCQTDA